MSKTFVKSADTKTAVSQSQSALEKLLRRYGASDFGFNSNYRERMVRVSFRVPDQPGSQIVVPVRLEISIEAIVDPESTKRLLFRPQSSTLILLPA